jgi:hypothetical protein
MHTPHVFKILEKYKRGIYTIDQAHNEIVNYLIDQYKETYRKAREKGFNEGLQLYKDTSPKKRTKTKKTNDDSIL